MWRYEPEPQQARRPMSVVLNPSLELQHELMKVREAKIALGPYVPMNLEEAG